MEVTELPLSMPVEGVVRTEAPISFAASDAVRVFGFDDKLAFCIRAAEVGEGGRGGGFIDCATARGMVLILADEVTGAASHCKHKLRCRGRDCAYLYNLARW